MTQGQSAQICIAGDLLSMHVDKIQAHSLKYALLEPSNRCKPVNCMQSVTMLHEEPSQHPVWCMQTDGIKQCLQTQFLPDSSFSGRMHLITALRSWYKRYVVCTSLY